MDQRLVPVEELGVAAREYEAAQAAVDRAGEVREQKAAEFRARHARARTEGWTAGELRELGLEPPAAPRRRRETEAEAEASSPAGLQLRGSNDVATASEGGGSLERIDDEETHR